MEAWEKLMDYDDEAFWSSPSIFRFNEDFHEFLKCLKGQGGNSSNFPDFSKNDVVNTSIKTQINFTPNIMDNSKRDEGTFVENSTPDKWENIHGFKE